MSGVMSNIQYKPSPHGVSKRIRLHDNEPPNRFQGIDQYGCPDKENLDPAGSNLLNVCEDANSLSLSSMLSESKHASSTKKNDINSFSSSTVLHSDFETRSKDKLSGIVKRSSSVISSQDNSKGSSRKDEQSAKSATGDDVAKTLKVNQYEHNTSKLSEFHYESGYQTNNVKYKTNSSEYLNSLHSKDNYLEKIRRRIDIRITPVGGVGEDKDQKIDENYNESYVSHKRVFNCPEDKFEAENVNLINHLNFEIKVLSWKAYSRIVKRLPDYKLFSDVIQKAMKKVKHPKIFIAPISSEESTLSNKAISTVTENGKVEDDAITKSKQNLLLRDLDEFDVFLDFVSSKIQERILLVCSTSKDIKLLESDSENILVELHHIQNVEYLAKIDMKLSFEDINMVTITRNEILTLGDQLLQKIRLLELDWMDILRTLKMNLVTISRFVYRLCSIAIESMLTYQRDIVFTVIHQIEDKIKVIEVKEKELDIRRDYNFSKMMELQNEIGRFYRLDEIFDGLLSKIY